MFDEIIRELEKLGDSHKVATPQWECGQRIGANGKQLATKVKARKDFDENPQPMLFYTLDLELKVSVGYLGTFMIDHIVGPSEMIVRYSDRRLYLKGWSTKDRVDDEKLTDKDGVTSRARSSSRAARCT